MDQTRTPLRIAVVGHVEHVTVVRVAALPKSGEILHLDDTVAIGGGGGGIAYFQLARSPAELHLFTAFGSDDAGAFAERQVLATAGNVHAARRDEAHTRDVVLVTPDGERSILVIGEPLHPRRADPLPWELLEGCRAVYFTAQDSELLKTARAADLLIVTARRRESLICSGVRADVVVGSALDPREASALSDYPVAPRALVMTQGAAGGRVETAAGTKRFPPGPSSRQSGAYGAGDSFAGALTWYLACGLPAEESCARAAVHGAAVLGGLNPLENQRSLGRPERRISNGDWKQE